MELRRRLVINGTEFVLAVNQTGKGKPTTATVGIPGVLYMDEDTEELYKCTAAEDGVFTWKPVTTGGGVNFEVDRTLKLEDGVLSVNTTNDMEKDNTLPITSAGVYATVGNIEALLKTI